jgi:hypothetical protein
MIRFGTHYYLYLCPSLVVGVNERQKKHDLERDFMKARRSGSKR